MFSRMVIRFLVFGIFCSAPLLAQQKPVDPASSGLQEFTVIMRQEVTAGKLLSEPRFRQSWWWEPWEMVRYSQRTPFWQGDRVRSRHFDRTVPAGDSHGFGAVERWIRCREDLPDRVDLPDDRGDRSGSPIRTAAVSGRNLERRRRVSRSEFTSGETISGR